ncbi:MAG: hypothetical protein ACOYY5_00605, partial [Pseudomonadota bacterium]
AHYLFPPVSSNLLRYLELTDYFISAIPLSFRINTPSLADYVTFPNKKFPKWLRHIESPE